MRKGIRKPGYSVEHESWFIPLTQGVIALVDADMVPILAQHNWRLSKMRARYYAIRRGDVRADDVTVTMHRAIMSPRADMVVDHIEHYPLEMKLIDNRRSNMRVCTARQNTFNQANRKNKSSVFKGVHWHKHHKKWIARIKDGDRSTHLGSFSDESEAARAYDAAAIEVYGEFALTNEHLGLLSSYPNAQSAPSSDNTSFEA